MLFYNCSSYLNYIQFNHFKNVIIFSPKNYELLCGYVGTRYNELLLFSTKIMYYTYTYLESLSPLRIFLKIIDF